MLLPYRAERLFAVYSQWFAAAALVEFDGSTIAIAGITEDELRPLVMFAIHRLKSADLATRPSAGEMLSFTLDDREVVFGIADPLIVIAVLSPPSGAQSDLASAQRYTAFDLYDQIARVLAKGRSVAPPPPTRGDGGGGTGSEPADLQVIEYGITVRRDRDKT